MRPEPVVLWGFLGLAALIFVLVAALATPLHLTLRLDSATAEARLSLRPLWGRAPALNLRRGQLGRRGRLAPRHTREPRRLSLPRIATLRRFLARVHVDALDLDLSFGTGDPADTGALYGYLTAAAHVLPGAALRLRPDFHATGLSGRGEARLHVTPLALVLPGLRLAREIAGRRP